MADDELVTARIQLRIEDRSMALEFGVPKAPTRARALLPILQEMTNLVVSIAEARTTREGRTISCAAGCGVCCRQLVPIAPSEARQVAALVEALPEPRRTLIRQRFEAAAVQLTEAGFIEDLRHMERLAGDDVVPFGLRYFDVRIACPFLEEESCSIHPDRPLACREYLVTSSPVHCADPRTEMVEGVHLAAKGSRALRQMDRGPDDTAPTTVPLIMALDWVAAHPGEPPPRPGPELLQEFLERLTGGKLPASHPSPT